MKVAVILPTNLNSAISGGIENKIRKILFRCKLRFAYVGNHAEIDQILHSELSGQIDFLVVCSAQGVVHKTLSALMELRRNRILPPIIFAGDGSSWDFLERSIRGVFNGIQKKIDVIQVTAGKRNAYFLSAGGIGLPALATERMQKIYFKIMLSVQKRWPASLRGMFHFFVGKTKMLPHYSVQLISDGRPSFSTKAPFFWINRVKQTTELTLASFRPLSTEIEKTISIGNLENSFIVSPIKNQSAVVKSLKEGDRFSFFGDGELLFSGVQELKIQIISHALTVIEGR